VQRPPTVHLQASGTDIDHREESESNMWTKLNQIALSVYTRAQIQRQEGQALVEYTLILALVSIVAIAVLTNIGTAIVTKLGEVEKAI
jgi:Flp pilus assembly pilin Flp